MIKKLSAYLSVLLFFGACSTGGGSGEEEIVTHTYTSRTSVQRTAGGQPVEVIKQPGHELTKVWTARLAFKNKTEYPLNIFFNPTLTTTGWADGTETFPGSPSPPDVTVAPGQVGTWTGKIKGKEKDVLPFCFQSVGLLGDRIGECHPASVFLGRLPAPPLRLLLTVAGPRFGSFGQSAYPDSKFSLAQVEATASSRRVLHLPGKTGVETITRPNANNANNANSQGGFVP